MFKEKPLNLIIDDIFLIEVELDIRFKNPKAMKLSEKKLLILVLFISKFYNLEN